MNSCVLSGMQGEINVFCADDICSDELTSIMTSASLIRLAIDFLREDFLSDALDMEIGM